ncbi:thiamine/thiamine pyrophosphate ABC transporter permease ThiP [Rhizobiaceae bacterium BDR2-2]|uniref:Thiamine transport system permease protein ThiP n=1 Tax=Ectorhizobium quercum TaxID=2965071 RepID=A0AAE3N3P2_9HYPH|nr:thiamine/thiamine pyrophosphate ABC transporter permease ThiP [Ectorhizobium quercum]MCX8999346.1 thiamine/thiamine pyrophosphate ABC transporter permease ThiP [Ectorhizobium quercum]
MTLLTGGERAWAISGGAAVLAAVSGFAGTALAALFLFDGGGFAGLFDAYTLRVLRFTLWQALLSTLLSVLFAIPVARALARRPRFPGRIWIVRLFAVPMGLPVLIGALGLIGIWGRQGVANGLLQALGLSQPVSIYGLSGILLAHVFFNMPLAARLMLGGLERIPGEYWRMAATLGMPSRAVFRFIEWPVILGLVPGIAGLIFMLCATSFTLVLMLGGGPAATTIEVAVYQALRFDFDPGRAVALSLMQVAMTGLLLAATAFLPAPADQGVTLAARPGRRFDGWRRASRLSDGLVLLLAVAFVGLPLLSVALAGLRADLLALVLMPAFRKAAFTSLTIAFCAGCLSVLMASAIVHAQAAVVDLRRPGAGLRGFSAALSGTGSLILLVSPLILGTGWFLALRGLGDVARFAPALVVVINSLMALPFVLRVLAPAFEVHRQRTLRLSASLAIRGWPRVRLVDGPVLAKPLLTALSFAMALSLGDLGAVALFGSDDLMTLPYLIYSRLGSYRTNEADGFALILGIVCLLLTIAGTAGQRKGARDER